MEKEEKFGTDYQALSHSFAYASKSGRGACYGDRMYYSNDTMYSYGSHFIIGKKIRDKEGDVVFILVNGDTASSTTSKQQVCFSNAMYKKTIQVHSDIANFKPLFEVEYKVRMIIKSLDSYSRARADHMKYYHKHMIFDNIEGIEYLIKFYRIKSKINTLTKKMLLITRDNFEDFLGKKDNLKNDLTKSDKSKETRRKKAEEKKHLKNIQLENENLEKWLVNDLRRIALRYDRYDYFRIINNEVQTTQSVSISFKEFRIAFGLLESKRLLGFEIKDMYKVIEVTDEKVVVGCHVFKRSEIKRMAELIKSIKE